MTFQPTFTCKYCERVVAPQGTTVVMCDCKGAREAWEREHRAKMERRKAALRGISRRK